MPGSFPSSWLTLASSFRTTYSFPTNAAHNWFPGHMHKGLRQLRNTLGETDLVVELHDARIPFSGRNRTFREQLSGSRTPHVLVFNKADLIGAKHQNRIRKEVLRAEPNVKDVFFTNSKNQGCREIQRLLPTLSSILCTAERYHRQHLPESTVLIVGIPNVGKSSIINLLRNKTLKIKGRATSVGNLPGVTRSVLTRIRISDDPLVYLIDSPGIMVPNIKNMHVGMKLALCSTLHDHKVGEEHMASYLLFWLNMQRNFSYVDHMNLEQPSEDIRFVLANHAVKSGMISERLDVSTGTKRNFPNLTHAARNMISLFRRGHFGRICLDDDLLGQESEGRVVEEPAIRTERKIIDLDNIT